MRLTLTPEAEAIEHGSLQGTGELGTWGEHAGQDPWPSSLAFRMVAFYMALFLIRPWETLFPWMDVVPLERIFVILTVATVVFSGQLWFRLTGQTVTILAVLATVSLSALLGMDPATSGIELYKFITVVCWYVLLNSAIRTPRRCWPWSRGGCS